MIMRIRQALQYRGLLIKEQGTGNLASWRGGVQTDHRAIQPGDIFVCIKGESFDGHSVIDAALQKGAACIVSQNEPTGDYPAFWVSDTRKAAAIIARIAMLPEVLPYTLIGITGTNGKTTTSLIIFEALRELGFSCGWIGTLGYYIDDEHFETRHTTPDIIQLNGIFALMASRGCSYVVMEVSSHALSLDRVYGVHFDYCLFSNLSRDHLDFHGDMTAYAEAKYLFFATAIQNKAVSIVNSDDSFGRQILQRLADALAIHYSVGTSEADYTTANTQTTLQGCSFELLLSPKACLVSSKGYAQAPCSTPATESSESLLKKNREEQGVLTEDRPTGTEDGAWMGYKMVLHSRLIGQFNVQNLALMAATLHSLGFEIKDIERAAQAIAPVKGRLESIPNPHGIGVYVDYAHTPDALENLLKSVSELPHRRILCLLGAGGDRDKGKRPLMLRAALNYSDAVIVADDNPRSENPDKIIKDIVESCDLRLPWWIIRDRRLAIEAIIKLALPGDVVLLCGKGHEDYQEIEGERHYFADGEVAAAALQKWSLQWEKAPDELILPVDDTLLQLMLDPTWEPIEKGYTAPRSFRHLSTDSRTLKPNSLFVPLKGENFDGHNYLDKVLDDEANGALSEIANPSDRIYRTEDSLNAMSRICARYLQMFGADRIALTGSTGKTTSKELIAAVLSQQAPVLKTLANENNLIGVCKTILRIEARHRYAVFELGTNHFGEIAAMAETVNPDQALILNIGPSHLEYFGDEDGVYKEKSDLFKRPLALRLYPGDDPRFDRCRTGGFGVGFSESCSYRITEHKLLADSQCFTLKDREWFLPYAAPHFTINAAFAIALALELKMSADLIQTGLLAQLELGLRMREEKRGGGLLLIDCYNANPTSMQNALEYWHSKLPELPHVAILGDMLELGTSAEMFHGMLGAILTELKCSMLLTVGVHSRLFHAPQIAEPLHFASVEQLISSGLLQGLPADSVILVKASHGIHLERLIPKLKGDN